MKKIFKDILVAILVILIGSCNDSYHNSILQLLKIISMEDIKQSQSKLILAYLMTGETLTPIEALNMFGCFRLGARIYDLKVIIQKLKQQYLAKKDLLNIV